MGSKVLVIVLLLSLLLSVVRGIDEIYTIREILYKIKLSLERDQ